MIKKKERGEFFMREGGCFRYIHDRERDIYKLSHSDQAPSSPPPLPCFSLVFVVVESVNEEFPQRSLPFPLPIPTEGVPTLVGLHMVLAGLALAKKGDGFDDDKDEFCC